MVIDIRKFVDVRNYRLKDEFYSEHTRVMHSFEHYTENIRERE